MQENELVKRAKLGDDEAFTQLAQMYKPYIQLISRRYFLIGGEQEDIYQEGLIGMYKAVMTFKEEEKVSFKTFATLCIASAIKTSITKSNTKRNRALNDSISVDTEMEDEDAWAVILTSDELNPEDELIKKQQMKYLIAEMNKKLKDSQKLVFKYFLENKSYQEIAQIVGRDTKYVDNTLTQIRKKLAYLKESVDL